MQLEHVFRHNDDLERGKRVDLVLLSNKNEKVAMSLVADLTAREVECKAATGGRFDIDSASGHVSIHEGQDFPQ